MSGPGAREAGTIALRGPAVTFRGDPFVDADALHYEHDALLVMRDGRIASFGPAAQGLPALGADVPVTQHADALLLPGFIDAHVHYPQLPAIGAFGRTLLEWLEHHTFAVEQGFGDATLARVTAEVFLDECLRQGTTTSLVYGTVHAASVEAFFAAAAARGMRMIAGKVMMDRNAPAALLDTAQASYDDSKALIDRWHGRGRLAYAVTPRFAPTSTPEQLAVAGALLGERDDLYLQTHLAETPDEVAWVATLFPDARDYLAVYERYGLVRRRSVFGHGVHLSEDAWQRLHDAQATVAHCPTSNNFLGSGHFRMRAATEPSRRVHVALATDVGGGTTLSMLATMNEAYKVARHTGYALTAAQALWLATTGAAEAIGLSGVIGSLTAGHDADVIVMDVAATPLIAYRMQFCESVDEILAVLMMLGDDRAIRATYVAGRLAHQRESRPATAGGALR
jgi:guanine deaminase